MSGGCDSVLFCLSQPYPGCIYIFCIPAPRPLPSKHDNTLHYIKILQICYVTAFFLEDPAFYLKVPSSHHKLKINLRGELKMFPIECTVYLQLFYSWYWDVLQRFISSLKFKARPTCSVILKLKYLLLRCSPFISIFIRHLDCYRSKNILLLLICDLVMCTCFFDISEEEGRAGGAALWASLSKYNHLLWR